MKFTPNQRNPCTNYINSKCSDDLRWYWSMLMNSSWGHCAWSYPQSADVIGSGLKEVKPQTNDWLIIKHWNKKKIALYVETEAQIRLDEDKFPTDRLSSVFRWVFTNPLCAFIINAPLGLWTNSHSREKLLRVHNTETSGTDKRGRDCAWRRQNAHGVARWTPPPSDYTELTSGL